MIQGSQEWIDARLGHVTCSRFADVMTNARNKSDKFGKTALSYMDDLICEHLTKKPASTLKTFAMEHGERWEPVAREAYANSMNIAVQQVGFIYHPTEKFIGCSPDGLCGAFGCEIKCPLTHAPHLRVLESGTVPDEHFEQIQGAMWVCSKPSWDFVSYHDDFPEELRLVVIRVERDEQYISELTHRVIEFRDELVNRLGSIIELWKKKVAA